MVANKRAGGNEELAANAGPDKDEGDTKEYIGAGSQGGDGDLGHNPDDRDKEACHTLPCHHCLRVPPREHSSKTIVATLLDWG